MRTVIDWLLEAQAKARRWWMWNKDEAILISSRTGRTWLVDVELHDAAPGPPQEHIRAVEIDRGTGQPLHHNEPEPERLTGTTSIFTHRDEPITHDHTQAMRNTEPFDSRTGEHSHSIDPDDPGYIAGHRHD